MLPYGAETWTLSTDSERRIESLEMWFYGRLFRINWTRKMTNISVKAKIKKADCGEFQLLKEAKKRKLQYCGQDTTSWWPTESTSTRSDGRTAWQRHTKKWGKWRKTVEVVRRAEDRMQWRHICRQLSDSKRHSDWLTELWATSNLRLWIKSYFYTKGKKMMR